MRITIVGGGNIGTQLAVHCSEKGHEVTIYTSSPELFSGYLCIVDEQGIVIKEGYIKKATDDPDLAFCEAEIILVTYPSRMMKSIADLIYEYCDEDVSIGVIPGYGGSECAFKKCIERGNPFFGIERVPAIARLVQKGSKVRSVGYRSELHISALPIAKADYFTKLVSELLDVPCKVIPNYLNLTLTPSNPILHTTRLRTLFKDWHPGIIYDSVPLFYEEWDDESSELLFSCDEEVQEVCKSLQEFPLYFVKSLKDHYESYSVPEMTRKISGIPAFKGLTTPTVPCQGGLIPDLHSRYFTSDFSYGLTIIKQIADLAGVNTPNINDTMNWYNSIAVEKTEFKFSDFGIYDRMDIVQFYMK